MHATKAIIVSLSLAILALTNAGRADNPSSDEPQQRDPHGDPLPLGAVLRLGTVRFHHDGEAISAVFSGDGRTLFTAGHDHTVRAWDLASAREQQRRSIAVPKDELTMHRGHRLSPDGKTLSTTHMRVEEGRAAVVSIYLWDLANDRHRVLQERPKVGSLFTNVTFSPDSATVAATSSDGDTRLWDVASGKLIRQINGGTRSAPAMAFSPTGSLLGLAVTETAPQTLASTELVVVYEVATGKKVGRFQPARRAVNLAFSPDGKKLAVADNPVRIWDMETNKVIREWNLDERVNLGGSKIPTFSVRDVAFSPDGKLLAVDVGGKITLLNAETGEKLRSVLGERRSVGQKRMVFSPDSRYLAVPGLVHFHVYDTATGKPLHDEGHQGGVEAVAFAPDGKTLATADLATVRLWDAATGKEVRRMASYVVRNHGSLAFTPDGKSLIQAGGAGLRLWNPATGAESPQLQGIQASDVAVSQDGATLAAMSWDGPALWEIATGKKMRQFSGINLDSRLAYSPDGKTLAAGGTALWLWDAASGKVRHQIEPPATAARSSVSSYGSVAFSPDGAYVAAYGGWRSPTDTRVLRLYEAKTGKSVGHFQTTACQNCHLTVAFSPDGKTLAMGDATRDVTLWEVITGKQRARLSGHGWWVQSLAFSPDGKRLASASADGTALVWDLQRTSKPMSGSAEDCWRALAAEDADAAYDAIQALIGKPEPAVPLLRQQLKPVPPVEPRRLKALVADLDSNEFASREQANTELEKLGDIAVAVLNQALAGQPPLETRQRIEKLIERLSPVQVAVPEVLQGLRGVEVLEHIGTSEAREVLRILAGGEPQARLTREARAAQDRLARQHAR